MAKPNKVKKGSRVELFDYRNKEKIDGGEILRIAVWDINFRTYGVEIETSNGYRIKFFVPKGE